jgi:hypothetical protein
LVEVHLFALLSMMLVLILAGSATGPHHRGIIQALLLVITMLVRNETSVMFVAFAAFCAYEELVRPFDAKLSTKRRDPAKLSPRTRQDAALWPKQA